MGWTRRCRSSTPPGGGWTRRWSPVFLFFPSARPNSQSPLHRPKSQTRAPSIGAPSPSPGAAIPEHRRPVPEPRRRRPQAPAPRPRAPDAPPSLKLSSRSLFPGGDDWAERRRHLSCLRPALCRRRAYPPGMSAPFSFLPLCETEHPKP